MGLRPGTRRDVAIKTLPDEFSRDPDRLTRFQRDPRFSRDMPQSGQASKLGLCDSTCRSLIDMMNLPLSCQLT
jgi:hypothetical protein